MKKFLFIVLIALCLSSLSSIVIGLESDVTTNQNRRFSNQTAEYVKPEEIDIVQPLDTAEMNLSIVFLGFNSTIINQTYLQEELIPWYAPIDRLPQIYGQYSQINDTLVFDVNYTINYEFDYRPDSEVQDYIDFLNSNSQIGELGFEWPYFKQEVFETANYIRSETAEAYLATKYFDGVNPTLVLIDTYSEYQSTFNPYYYNSSYADLDFPNYLGRRSSAINQVAGGGYENRLLFADYAAGPNTYYDYNRESRSGVFDYDLTSSTDIDTFNAQIEDDIEAAIEFRFLPSYIYSPITPAPGQDVVFECVPVNFELLGTLPGFSEVPTSDYNLLDAFDPETFVEAYRMVNPKIDWKYRIAPSWDWTTDPAFSELVQNHTTIFDENNGYIDSGPLRDYLNDYYPYLFTSTTANEYIIPLFLWFMPGNYGTDFGGIANSDDDAIFNYIINVVSQNNAVNERRKQHWTNGWVNVTAGSYDRLLAFEGYLAGSDFETSIYIESGTSVILEIMNMVEFRKFENSESYTTLYTSGVMDTSTVFSPLNLTSSDMLNVYAWVIRNTAGSGMANVNITVNRFYSLETGYTRVAIHEGGHGIGLSHPHDGFSWELRDGETHWGEYVDWLWDHSYTTMTYAATIPGFSPMDLDTYRRGVLPDYFNMLYENLINLIAEIEMVHLYIPPSVMDWLQLALDNYEESLQAFKSWDYLTAIDRVFNGLDLVEIAFDTLESSPLDVTIMIYGIEYLPEDENVTVEFEQMNGQNRIFVIKTNDSIVIEGVPYTNIIVTLYHSNGSILDSFSGITTSPITLTAPEGVYPEPVIPTSEDTTITSDVPGDATTNAFLTVSWLYILIISPIVIIRRKKLKR